MATRIQDVPNVAHLVGTGTNEIVLVLPDVYGTIGTSLGVVKMTGDLPSGVHDSTVGAAIKQGLIRKIKISYISNGKRKTSTLIVSAEKATQARAALTGKDFRGFLIKTAYYPTRITLG